jgi:hypothetical protein
VPLKQANVDDLVDVFANVGSQLVIGDENAALSGFLLQLVYLVVEEQLAQQSL